MLGTMQTDLILVNKRMRDLAAQFVELKAEAKRIHDDALAEATADDTADLPTRNKNYAAVVDDAQKVLDQLETLPAWADTGNPDEPPVEKYRIAQMIKQGTTLWVVVNSDPAKSQWPVFSSRQRHHAIAERDRLNAEAPKRTMYAKRRGQ